MGKKRKRGSDSLKKRARHSHETAESGGSFSSCFKWDDPTFFKPKEGRNEIDIIPYEIKSKNHPLVQSGEFEVGDIDYVMDIWLHRKIGPSEKQIVCLKKNYGKNCPICEEAQRYHKEGKKEERDALNPKRRVYYNVIDRRGESEDIQIFDVSYHLFEKELIEEARSQANGDEMIPFADIDEGSLIKFRGSMVKSKKFEYMEFKSFDFKDRDEELDEDLIDEAVSFDDIMEVLSASEIEAVLFGQEIEEDDSDEEEEEEKPKKKRSKRKRSEEEEEPKKSKKGKKNKLECPHGHNFGEDFEDYDDCDDCDLWDECDDAS